LRLRHVIQALSCALRSRLARRSVLYEYGSKNGVPADRAPDDKCGAFHTCWRPGLRLSWEIDRYERAYDASSVLCAMQIVDVVYYHNSVLANTRCDFALKPMQDTDIVLSYNLTSNGDTPLDSRRREDHIERASRLFQATPLGFNLHPTTEWWKVGSNR
jgi:hypothetical protein